MVCHRNHSSKPNDQHYTTCLVLKNQGWYFKRKGSSLSWPRFSAEKSENEWALYTARKQTKCILHGESAMRDYLNGDIDSSCGSLSREDPMLFGIPRWVVPPLIICDSSVRDAQMTRYFTRKNQEKSALNVENCSRHCSQRCLSIIWLCGRKKKCHFHLINTEPDLTLCTYKTEALTTSLAESKIKTIFKIIVRQWVC